MALNQLLITFAIVAVVLPQVVLATEFVVGDNSGWTINFNYTAWAKDKEFHVGDKLVFKYPAGKHNVFKVNGAEFKDCVIPPVGVAQNTGNDIIPLAAEGEKWYICGIAKHCESGGQKLAINVLPATEKWTAPAPAPTIPSSAKEILTSRYQLLVAVTVAIAMILNV
ncbi:hypothetical protein GIB67_034193 [Kingdonia uniflora]|uniref:Phytocyanin domain-containing protein n=1 Tax=Kingdonia uniflora TaxID=39325 RepID=A0A7J7NRG8_9MAGN|nr:hypothetical protein GIB67_034193 [Kingdonia uniflora]